MSARQYYAISRSNNKGAPPLTKSQIAHVVMVAGGSGRTPQRDKALLLCSITMGLRVTEIAHLEVRHIMGEDGEYLLEGWLPGTFSKSGKSAALFPNNKKFQRALTEYFEWRIEKRHLLSGDPIRYRGLRPEGKVFLTETGHKFAMSKKRRTNDDGVKTEYDACDVLERTFKRLYRRAFGEETKFSSHSGRKTFSNHIVGLIEKNAISDTEYNDVVELMRSHSITSVQPYVYLCHLFFVTFVGGWVDIAKLRP